MPKNKSKTLVKATVPILLSVMLTACCPEIETIKPEAVTVYVPQYVSLDESLTEPCKTPQIDQNTTWGDALAATLTALSECADKVAKIKVIQPD